MLFQWLVAFAFMLTSSIRIRKGSPVALSELDAQVLKLNSIPRMVHHLGKLLPLRSGSNIDFNDGQTLHAELHSSVNVVVGALSTLHSKTHAIKGLAHSISHHATSAVAEVSGAEAAPLTDDITSVVHTSLAKMADSVTRLETEAVSMRQLVEQVSDVLQRFQELLVYQSSRYTSCLFQEKRADETSIESSNRLCADRNAVEPADADAPRAKKRKVDTVGICDGATEDGRLSIDEDDMKERCAKDEICEAYALDVNEGTHDFTPLVKGGGLANKPEFPWLARVLPYRSGCTDLLLNVRTWGKHNFQDMLVDFETKGGRLRQAISANSDLIVDWSEFRTYVSTLCPSISRFPAFAKDFDWYVRKRLEDQKKGLPFYSMIKETLQSQKQKLTDEALSVRLLSHAFAEVANDRLLQLLNSLTKLMADVTQIGQDAIETVEQLRIKVAEFVTGVAKNDTSSDLVGSLEDGLI